MTLKYFYKPDLLSFFSLSGKDSIDLINRLSTNNINDTDNEITKTIFTNEKRQRIFNKLGKTIIIKIKESNEDSKSDARVALVLVICFVAAALFWVSGQ